MEFKTEKIFIPISESIGPVSGLVVEPGQPKFTLVLAHGAGAGMNHPFMASLAHELALRYVTTVRFNFSYMEKKQNRPDPPAVAEKTVAMVLEAAHHRFPQLPLFAGGKSFGGRMTSQRLAKEDPGFVRGIVFYGFPLHPLGAPSIARADHLQDIRIPLLFLQGTRDKMAEPALLKQVLDGLPGAKLEAFEGADHSFKAGKQNLLPELADKTVGWMERQP